MRDQVPGVGELDQARAGDAPGEGTLRRGADDAVAAADDDGRRDADPAERRLEHRVLAQQRALLAREAAGPASGPQPSIASITGFSA